DGRWLQNRTAGATCVACEPGRFSALLEDDYGATAICRQCYPGTKQIHSTSVSCDTCPPGTKAAGWGATQC
ncbi:unnamed protein product, partial [Symbiodinium pilosum]